MNTLRAAALYFAATFAAGFVLGTLRVLLIAPRWGEVAAVLLELPVMLGIAWLVCGLTLRRFGISATNHRDIGMGAMAFLFLMAAEFALGILAFGRTATGIVASYATAAGALGLASQLVFAALPVVRSRWRRFRPQ
ncbi:hypothetical protein [Kaistia sp. UC242_56]|uniref:hypothetical protein n=1 Tax=Kaistia sp. UC242_56 TaxID=3374625 RepID=UPI003794C769